MDHVRGPHATIVDAIEGSDIEATRHIVEEHMIAAADLYVAG